MNFLRLFFEGQMSKKIHTPFLGIKMYNLDVADYHLFYK